MMMITKEKAKEALEAMKRKSFIGAGELCVTAISTNDPEDILKAKLALAKQDGWVRALEHVQTSITNGEWDVA